MKINIFLISKFPHPPFSLECTKKSETNLYIFPPKNVQLNPAITDAKASTNSFRYGSISIISNVRKQMT